jgi:hypothetical protein
VKHKDLRPWLSAIVGAESLVSHAGATLLVETDIQLPEVDPAAVVDRALAEPAPSTAPLLRAACSGRYCKGGPPPHYRTLGPASRLHSRSPVSGDRTTPHCRSDMPP